MKKINLAENMLRFGVKNLNESSRRKLIKESNDIQPGFGDMVTYQGKTYAVITSAWDNVGFESNEPFIAEKIQQAGATQDNWVLIQTRPNVPVDQAYSEITSNQIENDWNQNIYKFVPATELSMSTQEKLDNTWEGFLKMIADTINQDANDYRTNLTSSELDRVFEKFSVENKKAVWKAYNVYERNARNNNREGVERDIAMLTKYFS